MKGRARPLIWIKIKINVEELAEQTVKRLEYPHVRVKLAFLYFNILLGIGPSDRLPEVDPPSETLPNPFAGL